MNEANRFAAIRLACARKPHGTRARYIAGCKCLPCRAKLPAGYEFVALIQLDEPGLTKFEICKRPTEDR